MGIFTSFTVFLDVSLSLGVMFSGREIPEQLYR